MLREARAGLVLMCEHELAREITRLVLERVGTTEEGTDTDSAATPH